MSLGSRAEFLLTWEMLTSSLVQPVLGCSVALGAEGLEEASESSGSGLDSLGSSPVSTSCWLCDLELVLESP